MNNQTTNPLKAGPPLTNGEFQDWLKAVFADDRKAAELILRPESVLTSVYRFRDGQVEHVELSQMQRDFMAHVLANVPPDVKERALRFVDGEANANASG